MFNFLQQVVGDSGSLVRRLEHPVLRLVSFAFSLGSAYAFASFLAPLGKDDFVHSVITVVISAALGLLGYFLSRGLAGRFMRSEPWWAYVPLFLVVEFLEIFSNYAAAIPAVHGTQWLELVPESQRFFHVVLAYLVYCCVPLVSPFLAVLDMDLERQRAKGGQKSSSPVVPPVAQRQSLQQFPQQPVGQRQSRSSLPPLQPKSPQGKPVSNPPPGVTREVPQPQEMAV